jgi:hypothetical protein
MWQKNLAAILGIAAIAAVWANFQLEKKSPAEVVQTDAYLVYDSALALLWGGLEENSVRVLTLRRTDENSIPAPTQGYRGLGRSGLSTPPFQPNIETVRNFDFNNSKSKNLLPELVKPPLGLTDDVAQASFQFSAVGFNQSQKGRPWSRRFQLKVGTISSWLRIPARDG